MFVGRRRFNGEEMASHVSFVIFVGLYLLVAGTQISNERYRVLTVTPRTDKDVQILNRINTKRHLEISFWTEPGAPGQRVHLMVRDGRLAELYKHLGMGNFTVEVMIDDVQSMAEEQMKGSSQLSDIIELGLKPAMFDYGKYHSYEDINDWAKNITKAFPDLTRLRYLGGSFEYKSVHGVHISSKMYSKNSTAAPRPALFFQSGMHAREWIGPATLMYMTAKLLDQYQKDPNVTALLNTFDVIMVPLVNPDGYAYTRTSAPQARSWRKTRTTLENSNCVGVDPNRNFAVKFADKGASLDPCMDSYCGPFPFFAIEVYNIVRFLVFQPGISFKGFIDFHSFSQLWMTPYGYTKELPPDYKVLFAGCQEMVASLKKVHGTEFKCGSIANIINYLASGSSADFTYVKLNITYSYGVELRDTGKYGFLLPADQIIPSGEETFAGLVTYGMFIRGKLLNANQ